MVAADGKPEPSSQASTAPVVSAETIKSEVVVVSSSSSEGVVIAEEPVVKDEVVEGSDGKPSGLVSDVATLSSEASATPSTTTTTTATTTTTTPTTTRYISTLYIGLELDRTRFQNATLDLSRTLNMFKGTLLNEHVSMKYNGVAPVGMGVRERTLTWAELPDEVMDRVPTTLAHASTSISTSTHAPLSPSCVCVVTVKRWRAAGVQMWTTWLAMLYRISQVFDGDRAAAKVVWKQHRKVVAARVKQERHVAQNSSWVRKHATAPTGGLPGIQPPLPPATTTATPATTPAAVAADASAVVPDGAAFETPTLTSADADGAVNPSPMKALGSPADGAATAIVSAGGAAGAATATPATTAKLAAPLPVPVSSLGVANDPMRYSAKDDRALSALRAAAVGGSLPVAAGGGVVIPGLPHAACIRPVVSPSGLTPAVKGMKMATPGSSSKKRGLARSDGVDVSEAVPFALEGHGSSGGGGGPVPLAPIREFGAPRPWLAPPPVVGNKRLRLNASQ